MKSFFDRDPMLRRIERRALLTCGIAVAAALLVRRGNPDVAFGVLGGALLMGVSYLAIRSSVSALVELTTAAAMRGPHGESTADAALDAADPSQDGGADQGALPSDFVPGRAAVLIRVAGRYALLGLLAYGMLVWLRLHPVGLFVGISSLFVAVALEAVSAAARPWRGRSS